MKKYIISSNHFSIDLDEIHTAEDTDYELDDAKQEYDSAKTSINSKKLPAIYNQVSFHPGDVVLDFGGGKFDNAVEYLKDQDVTLCVYDPYNRSAEHNQEVVKFLKDNGGADAAVNSNVLNVIKEPEARKTVLTNISKLTKSGAPVYIMVYEGTGKGDEGPTKSGYQLNRKTESYMDEIQDVFPDAKRRGRLVVAHNNSISSSSNIYASDDDAAYIFDDIKSRLNSISQDPNFEFYDDWQDYVNVDVNIGDPDYYIFEVRAELDYEDMDKLANELDSVVEYYDSDSYFDQVDPGIMEAYVSKSLADTKIESCDNVNIEGAKYHLSNDSEYYLNPPEDEPEYHEASQREYIDISFNQTMYMDKNGYIEWEDPEYHFVDPSANYYTDEDDEWMSDDLPNCKIDDSLGVLEKLEDMISIQMPMDEGDYRVAGELILEYNVDYQYIWDEYEDEEEIDEDSYDVNYDEKNSSLKDFRYKKIN